LVFLFSGFSFKNVCSFLQDLLGGFNPTLSDGFHSRAQIGALSARYGGAKQVRDSVMRSRNQFDAIPQSYSRMSPVAFRNGGKLTTTTQPGITPTGNSVDAFLEENPIVRADCNKSFGNLSEGYADVNGVRQLG
jgi:hypothetical protein